MNFALSFDVKNSDQGLEMVKDAIEFLAFTMKKREKDPVGGLLLDHLKNITQMVFTITLLTVMQV